MSRNEPVLGIRHPDVCRRGHPERFEDSFVHDRFETRAGDVFYGALQMKEAFTRVLEASARFECRSQFLVILRAPVRQARRVSQDVPRGDLVSPLSRQRILLQVLVERTIEVDRAILGQLEHDAGEDWFAERRAGNSESAAIGVFVVTLATPR